MNSSTIVWRPQRQQERLKFSLGSGGIERSLSTIYGRRDCRPELTEDGVVRFIGSPTLDDLVEWSLSMPSNYLASVGAFRDVCDGALQTAYQDGSDGRERFTELRDSFDSLYSYLFLAQMSSDGVTERVLAEISSAELRARFLNLLRSPFTAEGIARGQYPPADKSIRNALPVVVWETRFGDLQHTVPDLAVFGAGLHDHVAVAYWAFQVAEAFAFSVDSLTRATRAFLEGTLVSPDVTLDDLVDRSSDEILEYLISAEGVSI